MSQVELAASMQAGDHGILSPELGTFCVERLLAVGNDRGEHHSVAFVQPPNMSMWHYALPAGYGMSQFSLFAVVSSTISHGRRVPVPLIYFISSNPIPSGVISFAFPSHDLQHLPFPFHCFIDTCGAAGKCN